MAKEMMPIMLSCVVWGPQFAKQSVYIQCDNSNVVAAIKKGSARNSMVMHLLRCLWFFVAHYDIHLIPEHKPYNSKSFVKMSYSMHDFFLQNPQASTTPSIMHPAVLEMPSPKRLDWTSPQFQKLFYIITNEA